MIYVGQLCIYYHNIVQEALYGYELSSGTILHTVLKQTTLADLSSSMDQVDPERLKCSR